MRKKERPLCKHCGKKPVRELHHIFCSRECYDAFRACRSHEPEIRIIKFGLGKESKPTPYRFIYDNEKKKFVMEHRYVMEKKMGRPLKVGDKVFHINGDTLDNRIENLRAFEARPLSPLTEDDRYREDWMRLLDDIFGFSNIIMQPSNTYQNHYGEKTRYPCKNNTKINEYEDWHDETIMKSDGKGHMVNCYKRSRFFRKVKK